MLKKIKKWRADREEKRFIESIFGKRLTDVQRFNKVLSILKVGALSHLDLYEQVYMTDNGTAPRGQMLEDELNLTLTHLLTKELIVGNANSYSITEKGLDYRQERLNYLLLDNEIIRNRVSLITNFYIAVFTFIAAEYYTYEFLRNYISDDNTHKGTIINSALGAILILSVVGLCFLVFLLRRNSSK